MKNTAEKAARASLGVVAVSILEITKKNPDTRAGKFGRKQKIQYAVQIVAIGMMTIR
jgi:hypothetical protein